MTPAQFFNFQTSAPSTEVVIRADEIIDIPTDGSIRILLHGYNAPREDLFVGVRMTSSGTPQIGRAVDPPGEPFGLLVWKWSTGWHPHQLDPGKRIYPERTKFQFAMLLRERLLLKGGTISTFANYDTEWLGFTREQVPVDVETDLFGTESHVFPTYAPGTFREVPAETEVQA